MHSPAVNNPSLNFRMEKLTSASINLSASLKHILVWSDLKHAMKSSLPQQHVKDPGHSAKNAGGRFQLNTHTHYVCGFAWSDMVHGGMVYTERAETAAVSRGTSHVSAVSTPLRWIFKNAL